MVEPIRDVLYSSMQSDHITQDKRWISLMTKQVQSVDIKLTARLATATVSLRDVVNFKVGDVIPLDVAENVQATVDGVGVLECQYGIQGGHYALKVDRFIPPEDTEINLIAAKLGSTSNG
jgi:flagellar motor switch protein FliM